MCFWMKETKAMDKLKLHAGVGACLRPYNPCKTVKLDQDTNDKLSQMAKEKGTSRHAEMREGIAEHIKKFFKNKGLF